MEVILLEKVRNLGGLGDKIDVRPGFARNCLIPQNKAVLATTDNIERFEQRRSELEQKAQITFAQAEQRAAKFNDITLVVSALASDEGKLYGSVGVTEIRDALLARSIEVNRREVVLIDGPIHSIGDYVVEIHLHSDVIAYLQVQIVSTK